jgi:hypothetical protein
MALSTKLLTHGNEYLFVIADEASKRGGVDDHFQNVIRKDTGRRSWVDPGGTHFLLSHMRKR